MRREGLTKPAYISKEVIGEAQEGAALQTSTVQDTFSHTPACL